MVQVMVTLAVLEDLVVAVVEIVLMQVVQVILHLQLLLKGKVVVKEQEAHQEELVAVVEVLVKLAVIHQVQANLEMVEME